MQRDLEERTCNKCRKTITLNKSDPPIGGTPFSGWLHLERSGMYGFGGHVLDSNDRGPWDFCSEKCLIDFHAHPESVLVTVLFCSLPKDAEFLYRNRQFIKVDDEYVQDTGNELNEIFEGHYQCLITQGQFDEMDLEERDRF